MIDISSIIVYFPSTFCTTLGHHQGKMYYKSDIYIYIYTCMLRAILNKSRWQHSTKHQLYSYLPPLTKTFQIRQTRHAGDCWRSKDELISDVLQWTPIYGRAKAERPAKTYIQQLCEDTGCSPEDLPEAMNDREKWRDRVRDIPASGMTWWWWYIYTLFLFVWSGDNNALNFVVWEVLWLNVFA